MAAITLVETIQEIHSAESVTWQMSASSHQIIPTFIV
jgi:hypothetical protein